MDLTLLYSHRGEGEVFTTDPVTIPGIEGERPLTIYLPSDYLLNPLRLYPVAYLFDGQNLYDRSEWPVGWNLHHLLDERAAAGLEVPVVVGIHHGVNRDEELCPWPAEKGQTPRGDQLLAWIVHELHPQLAQQLRLDDRPERRMVGGSSLGGLLALYAGFRHSDFFGQVMSMSPSLWVGNGAIYEYIAEAAFLHNLDFLRLYIDCGALEADEEDENWSEDFWETADEDEPAEAAAVAEPGDAVLQADPDLDSGQDPETAAAPTAAAPTAAAATAVDATAAAEDVEPQDAEEAGEPDEGDGTGDEDDEAEDDEAEGDVEVGDEDEWETDPLEDAEYMVDILRAKGFVEGLHFQWIADPEGEHNEWHWSKRLPLAFAYLYDEARDDEDGDDDELEQGVSWGFEDSEEE